MGLYSRDVNNYIAIKQKEVRNADGSTTWVEQPDGTKNKGAYANPWASNKNLAMRLHKNPTNTICVEAVERFLTEGVPIDHTIRGSTDIRKFVSVRSVKGGAVKDWGGSLPQHDNDDHLLEMAGFRPWYGDSWLQDGQSDRAACTRETALASAKSILRIPGKTDYLGKTVRWYYGKDTPGEMVYALSGNRVPKSDGAHPLMELNDNFPDNIDHDWYVEESMKILEQIGAITPRAA